MKRRIFLALVCACALAASAVAAASASTGSSIKVISVSPNSPALTYYGVRVSSTQRKCRVNRRVEFYAKKESGFELDNVATTDGSGETEAGVYNAADQPLKVVAVKKRYRKNGKRKTCSRASKIYEPK